MLIDYHLHNHFSPDSEADTQEMIEKALEMGMQEICFTNHIETFHDSGGSFDINEARERFILIKEELEQMQRQYPQIHIRFGAELEYNPKHMEALARFVEETDFDFIVGSNHVAFGVVIASSKFAHELYSKMDEETAYEKYFDNLYKLVEWGHFDVVGHFDVNKKNGVEYYGPFKPERYEDQIMEILKLMKEKDIGLELNTKSMHNKCHEIFPHPTIVKWALEVGIKHFTISSDAHKVEHVSQNIKEAYDLAKELGIEAICTYQNRSPSFAELF